MRIITISREFGSGGRELGKRLAENLGISCYDHEIIDMIVERYGFDKNYLSHVSERDIQIFYEVLVLLIAFTLKKGSERNGIVYH